jgi:phosphoglycerate dehydrogenase-like enzyme
MSDMPKSATSTLGPVRRFSIEPPVSAYADAVARSGGEVVEVGPDTEGLIWTGSPDGLADVLVRTPAVRWVQLPSAGTERYQRAGMFDSDVVYSSAKGAYARPVAEHALALTLAALRFLPDRARATSWGAQRGRSLYGLRVLVIGGGGIAAEYLNLVRPFGCAVTVVRRQPAEVPGAAEVVTQRELFSRLGSADVLVLAAALTDDTRRIIDAAALRRLPAEAVLVNIGRGELVDTEALVAALQAGELAGAGLDVTDPEPLTDGHPLWRTQNTLITPHTADTAAMVEVLLGERIADNVARLVAGRPPVATVDPALGY